MTKLCDDDTLQNLAERDAGGVDGQPAQATDRPINCLKIIRTIPRLHFLRGSNLRRSGPPDRGPSRAQSKR